MRTNPTPTLASRSALLPLLLLLLAPASLCLAQEPAAPDDEAAAEVPEETAAEEPPGQAAAVDRTLGILKEHRVLLAGPGDHFEVDVGGTLDAANTFSWTRVGKGENWAVETMHSITLRNRSTAPVVNPRLAINGKGGAWSLEELVTEILAGATDEQEKAYRLWYWLSNHRYHWPSFAPLWELADPFMHYRVYGHSLCDWAGWSALEFYRVAGLGGGSEAERPFIRLLNGHVQAEVFVGGRPQFLDVDERRFVLDRDNRRPVSGDEIARDHDLFQRELSDGPLHSFWKRGRIKAARFGDDDRRRDSAEQRRRTPTPDLVLRPGEEVSWRWAQPERWSGPRPPLLGSGELVWRPLADAARLDDADLSVGFEAEGESLKVLQQTASVAFSLVSPFPLLGGTASFDLELAKAETTCLLEHAFDRQGWVAMGQCPKGPGPVRLEVDLSPRFVRKVAKDPLRRGSWLRLRVRDGVGSRVVAATITHEVPAAPLTLPALAVGKNQVELKADSAAPAAVEVELRWREREDLPPPPPPAVPEQPAPGATVAATFVRFAWPRTPGAETWHLQVSQREDFAWPYRPNYDVYLWKNDYEVPFRGMFSPDETYYWRLRGRSAAGVWGPWSPTWSFRWQGPRVPRIVAATAAGAEGLTLTWEPNAQGGTAPVAYRVYGSDEKGFSIEWESEVFVAGETTGRALQVVDQAAEGAGLNRAFYRVVAIDENGVESAPSADHELPRPWFYRRPPAKVKVGEPIAGRVATLLSKGDLQRRPEKFGGDGGDDFWDRETATYTLLKAPAWLSLDAATGELGGVPAATDAGIADVTIQATIDHRHEVGEASPHSELFRTESPKQARWRFFIEVEPAAAPAAAPPAEAGPSDGANGG